MGLEGIEQTPHRLEREEIMPWLEVSVGARLNAEVLGRLMPPSEGSFLHPSSNDPLKNMTWMCHGFLEAAADHLLLWADYAAPLKFRPDAETVYTLRPAFTLARATMESAAQAIWMLSPEDLVECVRRYARLATWDLIEQTKAAATPEARAELQARLDGIFKMLGGRPRTFRPPKYLDIILGAAEFLGLGDVTPAMGPDRLERIWRSASGAAHGKQWLEFELNEREEAGDGLVYSTPKIEAISDVLTVAEKLLSAGVILFAMRAGRMDDFRNLWDDATTRLAGRMTTVTGEPLSPEEIARLRRAAGSPEG